MLNKKRKEIFPFILLISANFFILNYCYFKYLHFKFYNIFDIIPMFKKIGLIMMLAITVLCTHDISHPDG